jgi:alpha-L-rhamnosidase
VLQQTDGSAYGQRQTAYRILVGSSKQKKADNFGDMWDSGWITSDNMQLVEYGGKPLQSDKKYYWTVA